MTTIELAKARKALERINATSSDDRKFINGEPRWKVRNRERAKLTQRRRKVKRVERNIDRYMVYPNDPNDQTVAFRVCLRRRYGDYTSKPFNTLEEAREHLKWALEKYPQLAPTK